MQDRAVSTAMRCPDDLVIRMEYTDKKGQRTVRIVSPIRFVGKGSFLALCLSRCEPRRFQLDRCGNIELRKANDYVMPVPIAVAV